MTNRFIVAVDGASDCFMIVDTQMVGDTGRLVATGVADIHVARKMTAALNAPSSGDGFATSPGSITEAPGPVKIETRDAGQEPCAEVINGRVCGVTRFFHGPEQVRSHSFKAVAHGSAEEWCARCGSTRHHANHIADGDGDWHPFEAARSVRP